MKRARIGMIATAVVGGGDDGLRAEAGFLRHLDAWTPGAGGGGGRRRPAAVAAAAAVAWAAAR